MSKAFNVVTKTQGKDPFSQEKAYKKSIAFTLNEMAFQDGKESSRILKSKLTERQPKFFVNPTLSKKTQSGLALKTARTTASIKKMHSVSGSVERPRFTGWEENQLGKKKPGTRFATKNARVGKNKKKSISRKYRLDKTASAPIDTRFGSGDRATLFMLDTLSKQNYKGVFKIVESSRLAPGLYRFIGTKDKKTGRKKTELLIAYKQKFKATKNIRWKTLATRANSNRSIQTEFNRQLKKHLSL